MSAFLAGVVMGLVFAVLGAGGGIIAVPVLMVLFSLPLSAATSGGLAVVFAAAVTAATGHARAKAIDWRVALTLGPASMAGAWLGARLHPLAPERLTAALFALVLLLATASLFRPPREVPVARPRWLLGLAGLGLGTLTGFLGVGGGFLLVPALVGLAALPLHRAAATSSVLIAVSSLTGAATALARDASLLVLVLPVAAGAVLGAVLGVPLAGRLPPRPLRLGFAALALSVAAGMAWKAL